MPDPRDKLDIDSLSAGLPGPSKTDTLDIDALSQGLSSSTAPSSLDIDALSEGLSSQTPDLVTDRDMDRSRGALNAFQESFRQLGGLDRVMSVGRRASKLKGKKKKMAAVDQLGRVTGGIGPRIDAAVQAGLMTSLEGRMSDLGATQEEIRRFTSGTDTSNESMSRMADERFGLNTFMPEAGAVMGPIGTAIDIPLRASREVSLAAGEFEDVTPEEEERIRQDPTAFARALREDAEKEGFLGAPVTSTLDAVGGAAGAALSLPYYLGAYGANAARNALRPESVATGEQGEATELENPFRQAIDTEWGENLAVTLPRDPLSLLGGAKAGAQEVLEIGARALMRSGVASTLDDAARIAGQVFTPDVLERVGTRSAVNLAERNAQRLGDDVLAALQKTLGPELENLGKSQFGLQLPLGGVAGRGLDLMSRHGLRGGALGRARSVVQRGASALDRAGQGVPFSELTGGAVGDYAGRNLLFNSQGSLGLQAGVGRALAKVGDLQASASDQVQRLRGRLGVPAERPSLTPNNALQRLGADMADSRQNLLARAERGAQARVRLKDRLVLEQRLAEFYQGEMERLAQMYRGLPRARRETLTRFSLDPDFALRTSDPGDIGAPREMVPTYPEGFRADPENPFQAREGLLPQDDLERAFIADVRSIGEQAREITEQFGTGINATGNRATGAYVPRRYEAETSLLSPKRPEDVGTGGSPRSRTEYPDGIRLLNEDGSPVQRSVFDPELGPADPVDVRYPDPSGGRPLGMAEREGYRAELDPLRALPPALRDTARRQAQEWFEGSLAREFGVPTELSGIPRSDPRYVEMSAPREAFDPATLQSLPPDVEGPARALQDVVDRSPAPRASMDRQAARARVDDLEKPVKAITARISSMRKRGELNAANRLASDEVYLELRKELKQARDDLKRVRELDPEMDRMADAADRSTDFRRSGELEVNAAERQIADLNTEQIALTDFIKETKSQIERLKSAKPEYKLKLQERIEKNRLKLKILDRRIAAADSVQEANKLSWERHRLARKITEGREKLQYMDIERKKDRIIFAHDDLTAVQAEIGEAAKRGFAAEMALSDLKEIEKTVQGMMRDALKEELPRLRMLVPAEVAAVAQRAQGGIPTSMSQIAQGMYDKFPGYITGTALASARTLDALNNHWKRLALIGRPAYNMLNVATDSATMHIAGVRNPLRAMGETMRDLAGNEALRSELRARGIATEEIRNARSVLGPMLPFSRSGGGTGASAAELATNPIKADQKIVDIAERGLGAKARGVKDGLMRAVTLDQERVARAWEVMSKSTLYRHYRNAGLSPAQAWRKTDRILIDYAMPGHPVAEAARVIYPFTKWLFNAPRAQLEAFAANPGRASNLQRAELEILGGGEMQELPPKYMVDRGAVLSLNPELRGAYNFARSVTGANPVEPVEDVYTVPRIVSAREAFQPLFNPTSVLKQVNPLMNAGVELMTGRSVVTDRPLGPASTQLGNVFPAGTPDLAPFIPGGRFLPRASDENEGAFFSRTIVPMLLGPQFTWGANQIVNAMGDRAAPISTFGETRQIPNRDPVDIAFDQQFNMLGGFGGSPVFPSRVGQEFNDVLYSPEWEKLRRFEQAVERDRERTLIP